MRAYRDKTAEEAIELLAMREYGQLKRLPNKVKIGGKDYTVYEEAWGSEKLKYIVDDGKIYKVTVTGTTGTKGDEVTGGVQSIQVRMIDAHEKDKKAADEAEEKAKAGREKRDETLKIAQEKAQLKEKLKFSVDNNNATIKRTVNDNLEKCADLLVEAAYTDNTVFNNDISKIKIYYVKINDNEIRVVKKPHIITVCIDTNKPNNGVKNQIELAFDYNINDKTWSCRAWDNNAQDRNPLVKESVTDQDFTDNIQNILNQIFGDSIEGWFDAEETTT